MKKDKKFYKAFLDKDIQDLQHILDKYRGNAEWKEKVFALSMRICNAFSTENKLMLIGNGGSAAQAQHITAEFVNRFLHERKALPALSLTVDTSNITSISNDYDFANVFERQVEALGRKGDILICLSTSGDSANLVRALKKARYIGIYCFSLLGKTGGEAKTFSDDSIIVNSEDTPRIQEIHLLFGHMICQLVEEMIVNEG